MPTPDRTSLDDIVRAGRDILESDGLTRLTMQAVADRVGVRAPSLYKRVRSRDALIGLIAAATLDDLGERLRAVAGGRDPRRDLGELARAFRAFAHASPAGYHLIFAPGAARPDTDALAHVVAPVLRVAEHLAGPEHALEAARTFTAWAHGFLSMELAGAFNLGGDVGAAYEFGIARLADALTQDGRPTLRRFHRHMPGKDRVMTTWKPHEKHGQLDTADRDDLPDSAYAFPKARKEPLTDAKHVRNAIARFDQVKDVTDAERDQAWANIRAAARHYDVEVSETSWQELGKPS